MARLPAHTPARRDLPTAPRVRAVFEFPLATVSEHETGA